MIHSATQPTSTPTPYRKDCCEQTTGLLYQSIDCLDDNTPIIVAEAQRLLMDAQNDCLNASKCAYSSDAGDSETRSACLVSWALLQQYHKQCPQIVERTATATHGNGSATEQQSGPQLLNPLIFKLYSEQQGCMRGDADEAGCQGVCDLSGGDAECGVCSIVLCFGDVNDENDIMNLVQGSQSLAMWKRALLFSSVTTLGAISMWGICTVERRARGAEGSRGGDMMPVSGVEVESD